MSAFPPPFSLAVVSVFALLTLLPLPSPCKDLNSLQAQVEATAQQEAPELGFDHRFALLDQIIIIVIISPFSLFVCLHSRPLIQQEAFLTRRGMVPEEIPAWLKQHCESPFVPLGL